MHASMVSRVQWLYTHQLTSEFYMQKIFGGKKLGGGGVGGREGYKEHALTMITNTDIAIIH